MNTNSVDRFKNSSKRNLGPLAKWWNSNKRFVSSSSNNKYNFFESMGLQIVCFVDLSLMDLLVDIKILLVKIQINETCSYYLSHIV